MMININEFQNIIKKNIDDCQRDFSQYLSYYSKSASTLNDLKYELNRSHGYGIEALEEDRTYQICGELAKINIRLRNGIQQNLNKISSVLDNIVNTYADDIMKNNNLPIQDRKKILITAISLKNVKNVLNQLLEDINYHQNKFFGQGFRVSIPSYNDYLYNVNIDLKKITSGYLAAQNDISSSKQSKAQENLAENKQPEIDEKNTSDKKQEEAPAQQEEQPQEKTPQAEEIQQEAPAQQEEQPQEKTPQAEEIQQEAPAAEAQTVEVQAEAPVADAQTAEVQAEAPVADAQTAEVQSEAPVEDAQTAEVQADAPIADAQEIENAAKEVAASEESAEVVLEAPQENSPVAPEVSEGASQDKFTQIMLKFSQIHKTYYSDGKGTRGHAHSKEEIAIKRQINNLMKKEIASRINTIATAESDAMLIQQLTNPISNDSLIEEVVKDENACLRLFQIAASGVYESAERGRIRLTQKQRTALSSVLVRVSEVRLENENERDKSQQQTAQQVELSEEEQAATLEQEEELALKR